MKAYHPLDFRIHDLGLFREYIEHMPIFFGGVAGRNISGKDP